MKLTSLNNNPSFGIITTRAIHAIRQQAEGFTPYNSIKSTDGYLDFEYDELSKTQVKRLENLTARAAKLDRIIIDCQTKADSFEDGTNRNDSRHIKEKYDGLNIIGMLANGKFTTIHTTQFKKSQKGDTERAIDTFAQVVEQAEKLNKQRKYYIFKVDYDKPKNYRAFKDLKITDSYEDVGKNTILKRIYEKLASHIILTRRNPIEE